MSGVADLQDIFQHAVLASDAVPGLFVREGVLEKGGFDLYINAYRARLRAALKDNYPVLFLALGDDAFADMANAYLEKKPSRFRSIRWFGDGLRVFLDEHPNTLPHPALADLASMDWTLRCAFDAGDASVCDVEYLRSIAPELWPQMRFALHPSVVLVDLNWRIETIWHALSENAGAQTEEPDAFAHTLLVWRQALECKWRSLGIAEAIALRSVVQGDCFADVCSALPILDDENLIDASTLAASMLQQWVADGLLVRDAASE